MAGGVAVFFVTNNSIAAERKTPPAKHEAQPTADIVTILTKPKTSDDRELAGFFSEMVEIYNGPDIILDRKTILKTFNVPAINAFINKYTIAPLADVAARTTHFSIGPRGKLDTDLGTALDNVAIQKYGVWTINELSNALRSNQCLNTDSGTFYKDQRIGDLDYILTTHYGMQPSPVPRHITPRGSKTAPVGHQTLRHH